MMTKFKYLQSFISISQELLDVLYPKGMNLK